MLVCAVFHCAMCKDAPFLHPLPPPSNIYCHAGCPSPAPCTALPCAACRWCPQGWGLHCIVPCRVWSWIHAGEENGSLETGCYWSLSDRRSGYQTGEPAGHQLGSPALAQYQKEPIFQGEEYSEDRSVCRWGECACVWCFLFKREINLRAQVFSCMLFVKGIKSSFLACFQGCCSVLSFWTSCLLWQQFFLWGLLLSLDSCNSSSAGFCSSYSFGYYINSSFGGSSFSFLHCSRHTIKGRDSQTISALITEIYISTSDLCAFIFSWI